MALKVLVAVTNVYIVLIFVLISFTPKVSQRQLGVSGRIFTIDNIRSRAGKGNLLKLRINFLPEIITLAKEVRLYLFKIILFHFIDDILLIEISLLGKKSAMARLSCTFGNYQ